MKKILIIGATSAMAEACARQWAARGDTLFLVARQTTALQAVAQDLGTRGGTVAGHATFDASTGLDAQALVRQAVEALGGLDLALIAHGSLTDQARAETDAAYAAAELQVNGVSAVQLLAAIGAELGHRGQGCVAVISSVAGDRGRQSNYAYGSAKALVSAYASGLRQQLGKRGVRVLTIKPGFVSTPMTAHLDRKGPLWATPERVAREIVTAMDRPHGGVLYTPWFWAPIMACIRAIPERLFVRLTL